MRFTIEGYHKIPEDGRRTNLAIRGFFEREYLPPKYNPASTNIDKWIRNQEIWFDMNNVQDDRQPIEAMKNIKDENDLCNEIKAVSKYGPGTSITWDEFRAFMVEFDRTWTSKTTGMSDRSEYTFPRRSLVSIYECSFAE